MTLLGRAVELKEERPMYYMGSDVAGNEKTVTISRAKNGWVVIVFKPHYSNPAKKLNAQLDVFRDFASEMKSIVNEVEGDQWKNEEAPKEKPEVSNDPVERFVFVNFETMINFVAKELQE